VGVKSWLNRSPMRRIDELEERLRVLEQDNVELRRHNLRLAELTDVVQELLVPLASRDQEAIDAAIEKFTKSL